MTYTKHEIPLIQKTYDFYKIFHEYSKAFPKSEKYTLAEKIKAYSLEILELYIQAETAKRDWKQPILEKASGKIGLLKLLARLTNEIKVLDDRKYLELSDRLRELGRMTGGWIKTIR